jgi:RHH-type rel operon transcriptional repressor/antitoxin RelB
MLTIRLDEALEKRLEALAAMTGRTKTFYAREAIEAHLDELERFYLAEGRVGSIRDGARAQPAKVRRLLEDLRHLPVRHSGDWRREDLCE